VCLVLALLVTPYVCQRWNLPQALYVFDVLMVALAYALSRLDKRLSH